MMPATAIRPVEMTRALPRYVVRFDRKTRLLHIVIMVTFLGLSATGLPLLFSDAPWARALATLFFGFTGAGIVHRFLGATLLAAVVFHVGDVLWRAFVRGERGLLWGPTSMMPQPKDFVDFVAMVKWFVGRGQRPRIEHFAYWEKFDYWAVLWGTAIMGLAGLILWFPVTASALLPGWMFNVALFVHGAEASLAIGFIFAVHFFNGHLRPGKFPMDLVIFTGRVSAHELQEERAAEFDRLRAAGGFDAIAADAPATAAVRRGYAVGTIGISVGLALVALILYATLR
jgi:cytochrome b subunit of formate dehydrogenase